MSTITQTVADTVTPEVLAQVAAAARQATIPVPSPVSGGVAAAPEAALTAESAESVGKALMASHGSPEDCKVRMVAAHKALGLAEAEVAAAEAAMSGWMEFARKAYGVMSTAEFAALTGRSGQTLGRLYGAAIVFDAYVKRGKTFALTVPEAIAVGNSNRGVDGCKALVADIGRKVDRLDVLAHRAAGKRVPGNYVPPVPVPDETVAGVPAPGETPTPTPAGSDNGTPVAHDETPALSTPTGPAAPNGSTDTSEVFTMPPVADWVRVVEGMTARADLVATGKRNDLMVAAESLHAALLALTK